MLSKKNRADGKALESIWQNSHSIPSPNMLFRFVFKDGQDSPKISFISPKTVSSKASVRTLLRRRGYAALRKNLSLLPKNIVGVFIFGKNSNKFFGGQKNKSRDPFSALSQEISLILNKIK